MWTEDDESGTDTRGSRCRGNSEVGLINENPVPRTTQVTPIVVNITNSDGIHVGPEIIKETITVHNGEVLKGRFFCLECVTPGASNRLRCGVAVFLCWAIIIATSFGVYFLFIIYNHNTVFDVADLQEEWYLRRKDWLALPPFFVEFLHLPIEQVIIAHSVTAYCNDTVTCKKQLLAIQQEHMTRRFGDIRPNFLVSGNGLVFEGRGANVVGATLTGGNREIISIMFLGNYQINVPSQEQFDHVNILLSYLVKAKILRSDYRVLGACQKVTYIESPGQEIMWRMRNFSHWVSANANTCLNYTARAT